MRLNSIIENRMTSRFYDEELWDFVYGATGKNLQNLSIEKLQERLLDLERGIQFLEDGWESRLELPPERGWISPWWWFRARHWTLSELATRNSIGQQGPEIPAVPKLNPELKGSCERGPKLLIRLSSKQWLLELIKGRLRLAHAAIYREPNLETGKSDDELSKSYLRAGQNITVTMPDGSKIKPIGDVQTTTQRGFEFNSNWVEMPYWVCSFSTDLDPRLFIEWPSCNACIIIFEPMEFVRRVLPILNRMAPYYSKSLSQVEYYDPHYPPYKGITALNHKHMKYANQREIRMILDPEFQEAYTDKDIFAEIGSIEDIAGVYTQLGDRIAGTGPSTFLDV